MATGQHKMYCPVAGMSLLQAQQPRNAAGVKPSSSGTGIGSVR